MALRAHPRGGPEQLVYEQAPVPVPGPGEALVAVHAAAITFAELTWEESWTSRDGRDRTPVIPSHEVSGTVAELGPDASGFAVGAEVYGLIDFDRDGAAAQYVTLPAAHLAARPTSVSHVAAASLPLAALTAWQALADYAALEPGEQVLVQGGAGGVGVYAVQLAAILGGNVTATGRARDREFVGGLGAKTYLARGEDGDRAGERIRVSLEHYRLWDESFRSRIVAVAGDLAAPRFGLDQAGYTRLAERIDLIFHNGARVNHIEPYARLRAANVSGTREVLRLATNGRIKPVHYISTANTVIPVALAPDFTGPEDTELSVAEVSDNGYVASKWVAEQLVRQAGERGVPVRIYRPGLVSGDPRSGVNSADDSFWNMIRAAAILGMAPDTGDAAMALAVEIFGLDAEVGSFSK